MDSSRAISARRISLFSALLIALVGSALSFTGIFTTVEDAFTSWRAGLLSRPPTGKVVIVEIDARSLRELEGWPWSRTHHAQLITRLDRAGAEAIAFDVDFSSPAPSGDIELSDAIKNARHVILPVFAQKYEAAPKGKDVTFNRPIQAFESAWTGSVNIVPERDGIVRNYPAATMIGGSIQPSLGTLLVGNDMFGDLSIQPDWSIDQAKIPRVSFVDAMRGAIPNEAIAGKRILVGATALELGDRYVIPKYGVTPGVVIHALAAESFLQGRAIRRANPIVTVLGILLIAFALSSRPGMRPSSFAARAIGILLACLGLPILVEQVFAFSLDSAAWLSTAIAAIFLHVAAEAKHRIRVREEFDAESGLPNRKRFELAIADSKQAPVVVVVASLERFETIREGIGLAEASLLVAEVARRLSRNAGNQVHRIGPGSLAWIEHGEKQDISEVLKHIQVEFLDPVEITSGKVDVMMTIGLAEWEGGQPPLVPIEHAMAAISMARAQGKSRAWYRAPDFDARRVLTLASDLRDSMENGRLFLVYQPKLSLKTNRISDAEALIRWHAPDGALVPPVDFIPLAEEMGFIPEITQFALGRATRDLAGWKNQHLHPRIAVNVSALDIESQSFVPSVTNALSAAGLSAAQLTLEITEGTLVRSADEASRNLRSLRDLGVRLSVDDYGTGQSTMSYLKNFPVHEVKIDKSFITFLKDNEGDRIMVRSTINLAHELGLDVVAEGIEDQETLDLLAEMGCDYVQGYFVSRPVQAEEFQRFLELRKQRAA